MFYFLFNSNFNITFLGGCSGFTLFACARQKGRYSYKLFGLGNGSIIETCFFSAKFNLKTKRWKRSNHIFLTALSVTFNSKDTMYKIDTASTYHNIDLNFCLDCAAEIQRFHQCCPNEVRSYSKIKRFEINVLF